MTNKEFEAENCSGGDDRIEVVREAEFEAANRSGGDDHIEVVREPKRAKITGVSRMQWWRLERDGKAPRRVQIGPNSVGWLRHELYAWVRERAEARTADRAA